MLCFPLPHPFVNITCRQLFRPLLYRTGLVVPVCKLSPAVCWPHALWQEALLTGRRIAELNPLLCAIGSLVLHTDGSIAITSITQYLYSFCCERTGAGRQTPLAATVPGTRVMQRTMRHCREVVINAYSDRSLWSECDIKTSLSGWILILTVITSALWVLRLRLILRKPIAGCITVDLYCNTC